MDKEEESSGDDKSIQRSKKAQPKQGGQQNKQGGQQQQQGGQPQQQGGQQQQQGGQQNKQGGQQQQQGNRQGKGQQQQQGGQQQQQGGQQNKQGGQQQGGQQNKQGGQQQQGGQQNKQGGQQQGGQQQQQNKQGGQPQQGNRQGKGGQQQQQGGQQQQKQGGQQKQGAPQQKQGGQSTQKLGITAQKQAKTQPQRKKSSTNKTIQFDNPQRRKEISRQQIVVKEFAHKQSPIFSHLPQYENPSSVSLSAGVTEPIHPAFVNLGLKYAHRIIQGSSARCIAMLDAFEAYIKDYQPPADKIMNLDLDAKIKPLIQFLADCRPLSIGMGNAIKTLKGAIGRITMMSNNEAKEHLLEVISRYRDQKIRIADDLIIKFMQKISDKDVILTYASSRVVQRILCSAYDKLKQENKNFRVIVVDSNPKFEGKTLLSRLVAHGINCTYMLLSSISYIMKDVSKVILGAHALLSNGAVISRVGSALVAMMAHAEHVPVLVACETYKFHERVQLDSICFNELEDPAILVENNDSGNKLEGWKDNDSLKLLNVAYDVTPMEYVSVVVTEVGMIPPTSVPVIIREAQQKTDEGEGESNVGIYG